MKNNSATPFLFLLVAVCLSANCNSSQPATSSPTHGAATARSCIQKVIDQDSILGKKRNHDCESISLSETIRLYIKGIDDIDFDNCPPAFTQAFQNHKKAWKDMIPVTDHHPDLRGEMHDLFDIIESGEQADQFKPALKAIWDTWADVEAAMKEKE